MAQTLGMPQDVPDTTSGTYEITNIKPEVSTPIALLRDHRARNVKIYPLPSSKGYWGEGDVIKLPLNVEGAHYIDLENATLIADVEYVRADNHELVEAAAFPHMFFSNMKTFDHPDMVFESREHHLAMNAAIKGSLDPSERETANVGQNHSEYLTRTNHSTRGVLSPQNVGDGHEKTAVPFSTIFDGHGEAIPVHLLDNAIEFQLTVGKFHEMGCSVDDLREQAGPPVVPATHVTLKIVDLYLICKGMWGLAGSTVTEEDFKYHTIVPYTYREQAASSKTKYMTEIRKSSIVKMLSYLCVSHPSFAQYPCEPVQNLLTTHWVAPLRANTTWNTRDFEYNVRLGGINYPAQEPVSGGTEAYYWLKKFFRRQDVVGTWGAGTGIAITESEWREADTSASNIRNCNKPEFALAAEFDVLSTKKLINGVPMERHSPILELYPAEADSTMSYQVDVAADEVIINVYRVIHYYYDIIVTFTRGRIIIDD